MYEAKFKISSGNLEKFWLLANWPQSKSLQAIIVRKTNFSDRVESKNRFYWKTVNDRPWHWVYVGLSNIAWPCLTIKTPFAIFSIESRSDRGTVKGGIPLAWRLAIGIAFFNLLPSIFQWGNPPCGLGGRWGLHWGWKSAANIPISVRTTTMAETFRANIWYREDIYDVSSSWNERVSQK